MEVTITVDETTAQYFAQHGPELSRVVKEFALVEFYRQGTIVHAEVGRELGFSQIDVH